MGETVNPLDHMSWDGKLLFIDARDSEQVDWLVKNYFEDEIKNGEHEVSSNKIILIAGKPFDLEKNIQQPVYFDQSGELTKKFNIVHVPAVVEQNGKHLKVTEIDIGKSK
jgi:conjugal transfer pilus assembly protein TraW